MTKSAILKFDGGARPTNPGPAAIEYILEGDDWSEEGSEHIGEATNKEAEYRALIRGLEVASDSAIYTHRCSECGNEFTTFIEG